MENIQITLSYQGKDMAMLGGKKVNNRAYESNFNDQAGYEIETLACSKKKGLVDRSCRGLGTRWWLVIARRDPCVVVG